MCNVSGHGNNLTYCKVMIFNCHVCFVYYINIDLLKIYCLCTAVCAEDAALNDVGSFLQINYSLILFAIEK